VNVGGWADLSVGAGKVSPCPGRSRTTSERCRPWPCLLPGVHLIHTGTATADQREMGAVLYAGRRAVLTGAAALRHFGVVVPQVDAVDVLVPLVTQKQNAGFARLHRTARLPELVGVAGEVPFALRRGR
jgi:hypothetical protein